MAVFSVINHMRRPAGAVPDHAGAFEIDNG